MNRFDPRYAVLIAILALSSCTLGHSWQPTEDGAHTGDPVSRVVIPYTGNEAQELAIDVMSAVGLAYLPSLTDLRIEQVDFEGMRGMYSITGATVLRFHVPADELDELTEHSPCSTRIIGVNGPAISPDVLDLIGEVPPDDTPSYNLTTRSTISLGGHGTENLAIMTTNDDPSYVIAAIYPDGQD